MKNRRELKSCLNLRIHKIKNGHFTSLQRLKKALKLVFYLKLKLNYKKGRMMRKIRSCVKWNGGKYSELDVIIDNLPKQFETYIEPFVGGGTVFWTLKNQFIDKNYHINDINKHLINFYHHLQESYYELAESLKVHENTKEYYLSQRDKINQNKLPNTLEMASAFYFVNKTCFSGKWQVNKEGEMTTGYANYPNSRYRTWSQIKPMYYELIQNTKITNEDYKMVLNEYMDDNEAFIFLDPPYSNLKSMYVDEVNFNDLYSTILHHLENSKANILMILGDGEVERECFNDFVISDYEYSYEFYGKAKNNKRKHLIIRNY